MDRELMGRFFTVMSSMKKIEFSACANSEMQLNELSVLQNVTGHCSCYDNCGTNLDVQKIQNKLLISKPAVSYILNALEKKEYISREIDPADRRKISVTATQKGQEAADQSIRNYIEMWKSLVNEFGEDDMRQLVELLTRLTELLMHMSNEKSGDL